MLILDHGQLVADGPMHQLLDDQHLLAQHGLEPLPRCPKCEGRVE